MQNKQDYFKIQEKLKCVSTDVAKRKNFSPDRMIEQLISDKDTFKLARENVESRITYPIPEWLNVRSKYTPPAYEQIWNLVRASSTSQYCDTKLVSQLFTTSRLSIETIGYLWAIANLKSPVCLTQQELYVILALIALVQNKYIVNDVSSLQKIDDPLVPQLDYSSLQKRYMVAPIDPKTYWKNNFAKENTDPKDNNLLTSYTSFEALSLNFLGIIDPRSNLYRPPNILPLPKPEVKSKLAKLNAHHRRVRQIVNKIRYKLPPIVESNIGNILSLEYDPEELEESRCNISNSRMPHSINNSSVSSSSVKNSCSVSFAGPSKYISYVDSSFPTDNIISCISDIDLNNSQNSLNIPNMDSSRAFKSDKNSNYLTSVPNTTVGSNSSQIVAVNSFNNKYDSKEFLEDDEFTEFQSAAAICPDEEYADFQSAIPLVITQLKSFDNVTQCVPLSSSGSCKDNSAGTDNSACVISSCDIKEQDVTAINYTIRSVQQINNDPLSNISSSNNNNNNNNETMPDNLKSVFSCTSSNNTDLYNESKCNYDTVADEIKVLEFDDLINNTWNCSNLKADVKPVNVSECKLQIEDDKNLNAFPTATNATGFIDEQNVSSLQLDPVNNLTLSGDKYDALRVLETGTILQDLNNSDINEDDDDFGDFVAANITGETLQDEISTPLQVSCLETCVRLLEEGVSIFQNIESTLAGETLQNAESKVVDENVLEGVFTDKRGCKYLNQLKIVYETSQRLRTFFGNSDINDKIDNAWNSIDKYNKYIAPSECTPEEQAGVAVEYFVEVCNICKTECSTNIAHLGTIAYHPSCINLFLHFVENANVAAVLKKE